MGLTTFGEAVRAARRQTKQTLQTMATALGTSPAFLSAMETGRSKVPMDFVEKVEVFFEKLGHPVDNLKQKAMVSNENVSLSGLSLQQQMLVAGFASSEFSKEQLNRFAELLRTIHQKESLKEGDDAAN
ncbi:helix-turn-helix domain-containing protein [Bergeriella denitrificans]|uniref:Putative HTH-type transcriptional regulator n=1 Tax=Bergeriella denitrificans TaxID=494 RepID=A0A378UJS0_BERDE|nr:helix-turn-helix transcriptional regulator [Bergeriella denitrificans]STZ77370.1 putative HTH-type transcriptional regulator [Bergeriella denitrificans]